LGGADGTTDGGVDVFGCDVMVFVADGDVSCGEVAGAGVLI
jgi:hypothetical protein